MTTTVYTDDELEVMARKFEQDHWFDAATLRALSAERDALKSELAEAVEVLQMIVGGAVYTAADGFSKPHEPEQSRIARAFLARHQK